MSYLLAAGGPMPAYAAIPYRPPLRRADAHVHQLTALMVPVRTLPDGRAWVPQARPSAPRLPLPLDVAALHLGHLGRWTWLDLLLVPLAWWLAAGWEPGQHRHPGQPGRRRYRPRHRSVRGDRPRPADGPSTRGEGRRRTPAAGWTHPTTTTDTTHPGETR